MSDNPEIKWALDLLKPDPNYELGFLQKYITEIGCMGTAASFACVRNWLNRRPFYSGIQVHITSMAVGFLVAQFIKKKVDDFQAERDTKLRDYIIRHPELFREPERCKYGDLFQNWTPVR